MQLDEAIELIRPAVPPREGTWVDLGAGSGLFSRAVARLLGPGGEVVAIDSDREALSRLTTHAPDPGAAPIRTRVGDFERDLPALIGELRAEGAVFANSLHYSADPVGVLAEVGSLLVPRGRVVVIEYDRRTANPWVPYPIPISRLDQIVPADLYAPARVVGERPSRYQGSMYCAVIEKRDG